MKPRIRKNMTAAGRICALLAGSLVLAACGGSGGGGDDDQTAGIGGTGIAVGKITDFGSIFVNGRKYNTDTSTFIVDGKPEVNDDKLAVGMVVQISVETTNGEFTNIATRVVYDDEVEGPVKLISPFTTGVTQRTFNVFGQPITIDATGTVFKNTTFAGLLNDDIVEISGFRESATMIRATYVEKKGILDPGTSEVELRGEIDQYFGGNNFEINGIVINIDPVNTVINVPGGLDNGKLVEVDGVIQVDQSINADEIEFEDDEFGGDFDEVSLQGIIANFISISDFEIDGLKVNASSAQNLPTLPADPNGLEVEVEGDIVAGVLIADEFELREGDSRVEARVDPGSVSIANKSFRVFYQNIGATITVRVNNQTLFEDEVSVSPLENMSLGDLMDNNFVRVEGQELAGELIAATVKRIDDEGEFRLEGAVDFFSLASDEIEILGVRYTADDTAEYEEGAMNQTVFFGELSSRGGVGTLVEIKDDDSRNVYGLADEVEFED